MDLITLMLARSGGVGGASAECNQDDALELATEMELISPVAADDGVIYVDENGVLYSL